MENSSFFYYFKDILGLIWLPGNNSDDSVCKFCGMVSILGLNPSVHWTRRTPTLFSCSFLGNIFYQLQREWDAPSYIFHSSFELSTHHTSVITSNVVWLSALSL